MTGTSARTYKDIASQLRTECRRATEYEQRAERAELAEQNLTAELRRASARVVELKRQVATFETQAYA